MLMSGQHSKEGEDVLHMLGGRVASGGGGG